MNGADRHQVAVGEDAGVFEVMGTMRAMRRLAADPVPTHLVERIIEAGNWAPSGSNMQRTSFVVTTDRELRGRLAEIWRRCNDFYLDRMRQRAPEHSTIAAHERMLAAVSYLRDNFDRVPVVITACIASRPVPDLDPEEVRARFGPEATDGLAAREERRAVLGEGASLYPAVQNILLAARALGLGANLTTAHLLAEAEWKQVLKIPGEVNAPAVLPIGWPLGRFGPVKRRPLEQIVHRDRW
jgi:nitroreductase